MKKGTIRTSTGGYATLRRAQRAVERGTARMIDGVLHMIESDHRVSVNRIQSAWVPKPVVCVNDHVGDSGMSIFPWIGYDQANHGRVMA